MRYLLTVALLAVVLAGALLARAHWVSSQALVEAPELLAIAVPDSVVVHERVTLYGGMRVPSGSFELGVYACQGGSCSRSLWRGVEGPAEEWGGFGSVLFEAVGLPATVEVRLFQADGAFERVVASWGRSVAVTTAGAEGEQVERPSIARTRR